MSRYLKALGVWAIAIAAAIALVLVLDLRTPWPGVIGFVGGCLGATLGLRVFVFGRDE